MKLKSVFSALLALVVFTTSVSAFENSQMADKDSDFVSPRSVDRTVTFDFGKYNIFIEDFDNSALGLNHNNIRVEYVSNVPNLEAAYVWVELLIDADGDGFYEYLEPEDNYKFGMKKGETLQIALPEGREEENYRLIITNRTTAVEEAVFKIESFYNSPF